ncbi:hypothetical protein [Pedobacter nyackensis]|uniref:hypothetical protein n=1 Tax=Pedobacter nyackensis TaxID=475255 RepID=UPI002930E61A|nr:hypothetical protein [Pedobacter nyackensis]
MKLKADDNIIEIRPDLEFANQLIVDELQRKSLYHRLHPTITDVIGDIVVGEIKIDESSEPFRFMGGNDRVLHYNGKITELYNELCNIVEKHKQYIPSLNLQSVDSLLFTTLFSWSESSERHGNNNKLSYLDELIGLYLSLKKKKVVMGKEAAQLLDEKSRAMGFDRLTTDTQEQLIGDNNVKAEARHVGGLGVNKLVYIPSDMDIIIADRSGREGIVVPERISNKIYKLILKEIVEEHQRNDTTFYIKLCTDDFSSIELESRSMFRRSKKNVKLLNYLILLMDRCIVQSNRFEIIKKHRYVLIYDILRALRYIDYNHPTREDKYTYIRTTVRDNTQENLAKSYGEKQLYR